MLFSSLIKGIEDLEKSKLMKKFFLIAILLPILSYNSYAQIRYNMNANDEQIAISYTNPKKYEVAEIDIEGEKYLDEIALKSLAGIKIGDEILQGDIIGTVGSTGRSTGPHLDFRINWFQTRLDPMSVLN